MNNHYVIVLRKKILFIKDLLIHNFTLIKHTSIQTKSMVISTHLFSQSPCLSINVLTLSKIILKFDKRHDIGRAHV